MGKASKDTIAVNLNGFEFFSKGIMMRTLRANVPGSVPAVRKSLDRIKTRIEAGENGDCLQAYINTIIGQVNGLEKGLYERVDGGAWIYVVRSKA